MPQADPLLSPAEFAQSVKAKYPIYRNVPDDVLAQKMLEKYPEYKARVRTVDPPTRSNQAEAIGRSLSGSPEAYDVMAGAVKRGLQTLNTVADFGRRHIPGVAALDKIMPPVEVDLRRTNATQQAGAAGEQVLEVLTPSKAVTRIGEKAAVALAPKLAPTVGSFASRAIPRAMVEAPAMAAMSAAQGGSPVVGALAGAAGPAIGEGFNSLAPKLRAAAEKQVVRALGPTKERFKAIAQRLAPEILKRGLGGSRQALQTQAATTLDAVGDQLDTALAQHGATAIKTQPILDALETSKDAFRTVREMPIAQAMNEKLLERATSVANGIAKIPVEFEPRAIRQLGSLQRVITELGPDATVDQLTAVRRAWDKVVSQAGGYAQRSGGAIGVPLKDQSEAFAKREGAGAIRKLLADEVPDLAAINKEYAFWKNLDDVVTQTIQRTQGQGPGLISKTAEVGGQVAGAASGGLGGAFAVGKIAKMANAVFTSPRWRLIDANLRNDLADAIASGRTDRVVGTLSRIGAVQASKVPGALSPATSP